MRDAGETVVFQIKNVAKQHHICFKLRNCPRERKGFLASEWGRFIQRSLSASGVGWSRFAVIGWVGKF